MNISVVFLLALSAGMVAGQAPVGRTTCKENAFKDVCIYESLCDCETEHEHLDLTPLYDSPDMMADGLLGAIFEFNPCRNFTTSAQCNDVVMCEHRTLAADIALGYAQSAKISKCNDEFVLRYQAGANVADVYLVCDDNEVNNGTLRYLGRPLLTKIYNFELKSRFACTTKVNVSTTTSTPTSSTTPTKPTPKSSTTPTKPTPKSSTTHSSPTPKTSPTTTSKTSASTSSKTTGSSTTPKASDTTTGSSTQATKPATTNTTPGAAVSLKSMSGALLICVTVLARTIM